jgi:hypothetical protein
MHGCETRFVSMMKNSLRVLDKRVKRRIFGLRI